MVLQQPLSITKLAAEQGISQRPVEHLENFFLRTLRLKHTVKREIDLPVVLRRPLGGGVLDADLLRVVGEVADKRAARSVWCRG